MCRSRVTRSYWIGSLIHDVIFQLLMYVAAAPPLAPAPSVAVTLLRMFLALLVSIAAVNVKPFVAGQALGPLFLLAFE